MKNFVKMALPALAFVLASAGAVVSGGNNGGEAKSGARQGWQRISLNNCTSPVMCNEIPSNVCTIGAFPAQAKVGLDCTEPLYHTVK